MVSKAVRGLFAVIIVMSALSTLGSAQPTTLLTRHVREAVYNGQAKVLGRMPSNQSMQLDVVLALRDRAGLESFLQSLYDPYSPVYRQFLSVKQFTERFGPLAGNYNAAVRFLQASGFKVVGGSHDAMDIQIVGSVATVEAAFHVNMGIFQHPTEDRSFYAPDREPSADLPFQLWHISGLDNFFIPRPALLRNSKAIPQAITGSCPQASFCGSDMRAAYYGGKVLTGHGQNIGLLEYAGFDIADVNTYYQNAGQTRTGAVTGISTDGTPVDCVFNQGCDDTEQTLDITQALGMAPGVTTVYMYVGSSDTALLGSMSTHQPLPSQLSASWIWSPSDPSTDDPYFMKMAAQGQNYFQASGDDGKFNSNYPTWPCDSAFVTSVGGTDLETNGAGGSWKSETAWVDGGGGFWQPDNILLPSWQKATAQGCSECSQTYRNAPDVSANSNFTFYVCADQRTCTANVYGGTSFAAPMWAGYLALVNEKLVAHGLSPLGFINPYIYRIGLGANYSTDFNDVVNGSNGYSAGPGYDLATGWGSPKAGNPIVN